MARRTVVPSLRSRTINLTSPDTLAMGDLLPFRAAKGKTLASASVRSASRMWPPVIYTSMDETIA
jgi:hypothetical protein